MMKLEYVKVASYKKDIQCPHNEMVLCDFKKCHKCGWHPNVQKARLEKIRQEQQEAQA